MLLLMKIFLQTIGSLHVCRNFLLLFMSTTFFTYKQRVKSLSCVVLYNYSIQLSTTELESHVTAAKVNNSRHSQQLLVQSFMHFGLQMF